MRELALLPVRWRTEIADALLRRTIGLGPLEELLADPEVSEVLVTAPDKVYAERAGTLQRAEVKLEGDAELAEIIERLLAPSGRRIDELSPIADAMLPDGSRVNIVIPPLAIDGPQICIRRFGTVRPGLDQLISAGAIDEFAAELLSSAVADGVPILISGGTSSGKTTLLAALVNRVPQELRVVTVEDAAEIPVEREHVVRLQSRPRSVTGAGEVTIRDLVRNAMRMRPDRLVVGEVRGAEALDLLAALNTGHRGVMSTIHANSPDDAISRLSDLAMLAGSGLPAEALESRARRGIELVVQLRRRAGVREAVEIASAGKEAGLTTLWSRPG